MPKKKSMKKVIIAAIVSILLVGGVVYFGVTKKNYQSFSDSFKKMEISSDEKEQNIEKLKKFAEKKGYTYSKVEKSDKLMVLVVSKDYVQNLMYSPEENRLNYRKMNSADISESQKKKVKALKVGDSFEKVMRRLGEPDKMEKDHTGKLVVNWGSVTKYSQIAFVGNKVVEVKEGMDD